MDAVGQIPQDDLKRMLQLAHQESQPIWKANVRLAEKTGIPRRRVG